MSQQIAAYAEGMMSSTNLANNYGALAASDLTTLMVSLFHIMQNGDIYFNDRQHPICVGGKYVGAPTWPAQLQTLLDGSSYPMKMLFATFGGGGCGDFTNVSNIYTSNQRSFCGTTLLDNLQAFYTTFKGIFTAIDMDNEDCYDTTIFVPFCQMIIGLGFQVSFCPAFNQDFWVDSLVALNITNPNQVIQWNLQGYAGADPSIWSGYITNAIPGFDISNYLLGSGYVTGGEDPAVLQNKIEKLAQGITLAGAYFWTADNVLTYATENPANPPTLSQYAYAMQQGLAGNASSAK